MTARLQHDLGMPIVPSVSGLKTAWNMQKIERELKRYGSSVNCLLLISMSLEPVCGVNDGTRRQAV
jgi:hypothetical protein